MRQEIQALIEEMERILEASAQAKANKAKRRAAEKEAFTALKLKKPEEHHKGDAPESVRKKWMGKDKPAKDQGRSRTYFRGGSGSYYSGKGSTDYDKNWGFEKETPKKTKGIFREKDFRYHDNQGSEYPYWVTRAQRKLDKESGRTRPEGWYKQEVGRVKASTAQDMEKKYKLRKK